MKKLLVIALSLIVGNSYAQKVGVNTATPKQQLDVNGKIVVSDDATLPTEGTIRYNSSDKAFEGYDGTKWVSLSKQSASSLPTNPVPIYGNALVSLSSQISLNFYRQDGTGGSFKAAPAGKYLIITSIFMHSNNLGTENNISGTVGSGSSLDNFADYSNRFFIRFPRLSSYFINSGGGAPLFVVRPGQYFNASNESGDFSNSYNIKVQGFIVDNLVY